MFDGLSSDRRNARTYPLCCFFSPFRRVSLPQSYVMYVMHVLYAGDVLHATHVLHVLCVAHAMHTTWRLERPPKTIWARAVVNASEIGLHKRPEKATFDHIFYRASLRGYNGLALHCRAGPRCARAKKFLYLNLFIFIIYIMRHYQDR